MEKLGCSCVVVSKGFRGLEHVGSLGCQMFQACTPRVLPLGFGILSRDARGPYKGYIKALLGKPSGGTILGV